MAATTNGGDAAASLDKIQAPPGIIIPPPGEIREAIEKTAGYVVRGGTGLEMRIRENHGQNPKFSFLMTDKDPYNAYYEWRKAEIKGGRGTAVAAGRVGEDAAAAAQKAAAPKGPEKPPDFQFSARMPRMNQKDLEVLRLTALFVARNGRQFMTQLAQRENGNPQFSFLIPNHTFHNVFQSMVDQYSIILKEGGLGGGGGGGDGQQARMAELRRNVEDKYHVLARTKQRAEYARWLEAEKKKQEEEEEKKKTEFFSIDWNDFVLVETISFTEADETINLPPPTTLNDLQYASLEEKNKVSLNSLRIEEAFPFDDTSYNAHPVQNYGVQGSPWQQQNSTTSQTNGAYAPPPVPVAQGISAREEEEAQRIREREESRARVQQAQADARARVAPGKIKENYVPRAASRNVNKVQTTICPNCRQEIPLDEFDEHTRIELLDPRWKEQKAKADARAAPINLTVDVAQNLKRLASQRHDVFDPVTGQAISEEEQERRKRVALNSFDGAKVDPYKSKAAGAAQQQGNPMQAVSVEEQIRQIHQKFAGDGRGGS